MSMSWCRRLKNRHNQEDSEPYWWCNDQAYKIKEVEEEEEKKSPLNEPVFRLQAPSVIEPATVDYIAHGVHYLVRGFHLRLFDISHFI